VGGGSLLYTAITHVPYEIDYRVWAEETGTDWNYQNLKPAGDEIMRMLNIHVKPEALLRPVDRLFRDAARSLGYSPDDATIARQNCLYCGYCDGVNMCKYDARLGGFVAYLPIALEHGVEVIPNAEVEKVLIEKTSETARVQGVTYTQQGIRKTLQAPKVLVSSGTFGTPPLLYRSGYGPRRLVDNPVIVENPNVGRNTDCRPSLEGLVGIFDEPISDGEYRDGNVAGAFWVYHDTTADHRYERVEITVRANELMPPHTISLGSGTPQFGQEHKEYMRGIDAVGTSSQSQRELLSRCFVDIRLIRPRTVRGYVNEWGEHIYRGNDPTILKPLEEGREVAYEILKKMGAREVVGMNRPPRVRGLPTYVGSCQSGESSANSVIDSYFESHDIEGLFICDGSAVPRGATQGYGGTVATLAAFGASRIVERHFTRG
jgi:choline dehydrogenase-like flavoprotein